MESGNFNFSSLIDLVLKNIKSYIIVAIVAAVLAAVVSMPFIMVPRYTSVAVAYPLNLEPYSDESETEQLLQYFESSSVRDSIIDKFDLYNRYGIDRDKESARYYVVGMFSERFTVKKTIYESVRVEVVDEDPKMAKIMADEYLNQVNRKINRSVNEQGAGMAASYKQQMDYHRAMIDSLEAAISRLSSEARVLDYRSQTRELVRGYVELAGKGQNNPAFKEINDWMNSAQEYGSTLQMLQNLSYFAIIQLDQLSKEYYKWREFQFRQVNYMDLVVEPEVSDKKTWPVRWLILSVSVVSALILLTVLLALSEALRKR